MIILECINKHPIVYISVQEWGANIKLEKGMQTVDNQGRAN